MGSDIGDASATKTAAWGMEKDAVAKQLNPTRVRIDHRQRSLESLWRPGTQATQPIDLDEDSSAIAPVNDSAERKDAFEEAQQLTSICELKAEAVLKAEEQVSK